MSGHLHCTIPGCNKVSTSNVCPMHTARIRRHGDPFHFQRPTNGTPHQETVKYFLSRTVESANGCLEWAGQIHYNGYGWFCKGYAHRFAYRTFVGPIPAGYDVCHHCDNRRCVRPSHLFTGTRKDNMQDAKRKGRLRRSLITERNAKGQIIKAIPQPNTPETERK